MIRSVKLQNFLSFGPNSAEIELQNLNVIIGRNGSGKSNFIEAIDLLRHTPANMTTPIREGGGVANWLYKGERNSGKRFPATMEFVFDNKAKISKDRFPRLLYSIKFVEEEQRFMILDEKVTSDEPEKGEKNSYIFYSYGNGNPVLNVRSGQNYKKRKLAHEDIFFDRSILSQRSDPDSYPEITSLANELRKIKLYREWLLGRYTAMRTPVGVDAPNDFMEENCTNLPLVLNKLDFFDGNVKSALLDKLRIFYRDVDDYLVKLEGGTAQLFFQEEGLNGKIPATRLSDGTLRYMFLLSILLHPAPPPVICIEEPELGLHPDILPEIGKLMIEASERCQLIVTTHSAALIDSLSCAPEYVLVAEKTGEGTEFSRLSREELDPWLKEYTLGELWSRGDLGGTIW